MYIALMIHIEKYWVHPGKYRIVVALQVTIELYLHVSFKGFWRWYITLWIAEFLDFAQHLVF
jgi:hypothetical protein